MKVLMLCLEFPPVNTTGNYRSAGFARYFSANGIETIVLTCDVKSGEDTFNKKADYSLLNGLENVRIHRFPIKPMRNFWRKGIGNSLRIWWNSTDKIDRRWYFGENKKKIAAIINKESPDVLYVSLPPFSLGRTALSISKEFNLPLITDMRDAWSLWVTSSFSTRFHYYRLRKFENKLFKGSDLVLGVTPELVKDFISQHTKINKNKFHTIYNGYDNLDLKEFTNKKVDDLIYRIGYIGSFYYNPSSDKTMSLKWHKRRGLKKFYYSPRKEKWIYRSPYFFLKTLSLLLEENKTLKSKIYFEFIGSAPEWLNKMIIDFGLEDNFINHGFKSNQEVLEIQSNWDAILATSEKVEEGEHFCLPSKLFDGVASGKRILAFLTPGSQYNFLKAYRQVSFFDPDNALYSMSQLKDIVTRSSVGFKSDNISDQFKREYQTERLTKLLKENF
jgi:hypothetical protein